MYRLNKTTSFIILFVVIYICNNINNVNAQSPLIGSIISYQVDGVDPYVPATGRCTFSIRAKGALTINSQILSDCTLITTPVSPTSCSMTDVYTNATHFSVIFNLEVYRETDPYTQLSVSILSNTFLLLNQDGSSITYTCEDAPIAGFDAFTAGDSGDFVTSSYVYSNFKFRFYLKLSPQLKRPITEWYCSGGYSCEFVYLSLESIIFTITFSDTYTSPFPSNLIILYKGTARLSFASPLTRGDYGTLSLNIPKKKFFNNNPSYGYYLRVVVSTNYNLFPPVSLPLVPLEGTSMSNMTFNFNWKTAVQPRMIVGGVLDYFYQTLLIGPISNVPIVAFYFDSFMTISFKTSSKPSISPNQISSKLFVPYPYGLVKVSASSFRDYTIPVANSKYSKTEVDYYVYLPDTVHVRIIGPNNVPPTDTLVPVIVSWDVLLLNSTHSILRLGASDNYSGVDYILVTTNTHQFYLTKKNLVSGSSTHGSYETFIPYKKSLCAQLEIRDIQNNSLSYSNTLLNFNYGVTLGDSNYFTKISSLYFDPPVVDVSTSSANVVLYLNLTQTLQERLQENTVFLELLFNPYLDNPLVQGVYDTTKQLYVFPFKVPSNLMAGNVNYTISINGLPKMQSYLFYDFADSSLLVTNTRNIDMVSPVVSKLTTDNQQKLEWNLEFYDLSGVKKVIVGISSDFDVQGRNFTKLANGETILPFKVSYPVNVDYCRAMNYWISYIYTEDILGNKGETIRYSNSKMHPFFDYDEGSIDILSTATISNCLQPTDISPPELNGLSITHTYGNTTDPNQQALIQFSLADISGISPNHIPTCYFTAEGNDLLSAKAKVLIQSGSSVSYECQFVFPIKFGPTAFLSIYGASDLYYNLKGFTALDIHSRGFESNFTIDTFEMIYIESTSSLELSSQVLEIYGTGFGFHPNCVLKIEMDILNVTLPPDMIFGSALILYNLEPSYQYKISVYDQSSNLQSNQVVLKGPLSIPLTPDPTPTPTLNPPLSPKPEEQTCKSNCGNDKGYGKCINGVCVCVSPHTGIDCLSVVDTTPIITPNPDQPTVNITIKGTSSGETPQFTSFVSIVALRELDNTGNLINNHQFNSGKWIIVNQGSSSNDQLTTIQYKYIIDNSLLNTTIISTVQVFNTAANITFGNQKLYMNPSTIKFTFNITSYSFTKSTNSLQLVMTAGLESVEKIGCSYKEFVDDQTNSQYLKLQIENRSLYGRFIKFGFIDGRQVSVTNTQLDNIYGGKELSSSTSDQSYIGLNIPYYTQSVLIDPDFSVLIEQNTARDQDNSICTSANQSKKLTNAQIAGIVVGGAVFLFIILAIIIYFYTQKSTSPIALKLRRIGTN